MNGTMAHVPLPSQSLGHLTFNLLTPKSIGVFLFLSSICVWSMKSLRWRGPNYWISYLIMIVIYYWIIQRSFPTLNACILIKVCRLRRKTFLFLLCSLLLRSADYVGRPFCFCSVSYYYFYYSFLFFSTADFLQRFLRHFPTDLDKILAPW